MLIKNEELSGSIIGIYVIRDLKGIELYVGGGDDVLNCFYRHRWNLENGHYNKGKKKELQARYDAGEDFYFELLDTCTEDQLNELETFYILKYNDTILNTDKSGKRRVTKPTAEETERRKKANMGSRNPRAILDLDDVMTIKVMLSNGVSMTEIARKFKVSVNHVNNIAKGYRWSHVQAII